MRSRLPATHPPVSAAADAATLAGRLLLRAGKQPAGWPFAVPWSHRRATRRVPHPRRSCPRSSRPGATHTSGPGHILAQPTASVFITLAVFWSSVERCLVGRLVAGLL